MTDDEEYDGEAVSDLTFGYRSNTWLLKAMLYYAPPGQVWNGIAQAINYLTLDKNPEIGTALDILAQFAANGRYTPTFEHDHSEHEGPHPLNPTTRHFTEPGNPLSEAEQEDILEKFRATLGLVPEQDEGKEGDD